MSISKVGIFLAWSVAVLSVVAAGAGLIWPGGSGPFAFTTLRGDSVDIYGWGLYRYDSLLIGAGFRGIDGVLLGLAVPLLAYATVRYGHGSLRGGLLLTAMLGFFLYNYSSMTFGAAYNELFLLYVTLFSSSLFAFILVFTSLDVAHLSAHIRPRMPHRALTIFMFATGLVFMAVWLVLGIAVPMLQGSWPGELAAYTTLVTHAVDLGVLMPTAWLTGVLLRRRAPLGYPLALTMLVLGIFIVGLSMPAATLSQVAAGYTFATGQIIVFIVPFFILGIIALVLAVVFLRNIGEAPARPTRAGIQTT